MVKTFYLVASLVLAVMPQQKAAVDGSAWEKAKEGLLVVEHLGVATGVAALIDQQGLLLVHRSALRTGPMSVRMHDGTILSASVVGQDEVTQTAVLQIVPIFAGTKALGVAMGSAQGERILAATAAGPVFGQIAATNRVGQMRPSLRYLPLSEVWLESGSATLAPAVLVNERGEIVGLLGASLAEESPASALLEGANQAGARSNADYGPGTLQVSYAVGPKVMKRVVDGFRSPSRVVKHPTVGVLFRMSPGAGGVILETVMDGSTAQVAGLRPGDRVVSVDGKAISDSVQLAIALFEASPGDTVTIIYERDGQNRTAKVLVSGQELVLTSRTSHL